MRRTRPFIAALAILVLAPVHLAHADDRSDHAHALRDDALQRIARGTPEQRQAARAELEQAWAMAPADASIGLPLARLYLDADMLRLARSTAEAVLAHDSLDAAAEQLLGLTWRRTWLVDAEEIARDRALVHFARALRFGGPRGPVCASMAPLLLDAGETDRARVAAQVALEESPRDPAALALLATTLQRAGRIQEADRYFRDAIPRLPAVERLRYDDVTPLVLPGVAAALEEMAPARRAAFAGRFWQETDPDPVTKENEAQLEFWARVTQALRLYGRGEPGRWDMRAQLLARYGPPELVERNALTRDVTLGPEETWLVWAYPALGMRVWMQASNPLAAYHQPFTRYAFPTLAYPDSLARRGTLQGVQWGWAVFSRLPETASPLETRCALLRFEGADGGRLLAHAEAPGDPTDDYTAEWAVLDSAYHEVARGTHAMSASACGPTQALSASWTADLAPGSYRVGVHVRGADGRLGVLSRDLTVPAAGPGLGLSDIVVTCSPPELGMVPGSGVRLEPQTGLLPERGEQVNAYFEVYRLAPGAAGQADFEYVCTVRRAQNLSHSWLSRVIARGAEPAPIEVTRRGSSGGALRRQYLTIPVGPLPAGDYDIEIRVRDLNAGTETSGHAAFQRRI
jgi:GWxTD domain-containing protein